MNKPRLSKGVVALEEADFAGSQLMWMLVYRAKRLGMTQKEAAETLGITRAYFEALMWNRREVSDCRHEILIKMAEFLDMPVAQVYLHGGILRPRDFVRARDLEERMLLALTELRNDPMFSVVVPDEVEWAEWPLDMRLTICLLRDEVRGTSDFVQTEISGGDSVQALQDYFIASLNLKMAKGSWTLEVTADKLAMSVTFLRGILAKRRPLTALKRIHIERLADLFDIPIAQVYFMSGILVREDFLWHTDVESRVNAVYEAMRVDRLWTGFIPSVQIWDGWPLSGRLLLAHLYESGARTNPVSDVIEAAREVQSELEG